MKVEDIKKMGELYKSVIESKVQEACSKKSKMEEMDPVDKKEIKKDFDDKEDQDIDNDGDTDSSDEYLHNRRKAISKNVKEKSSVKEFFDALDAVMVEGKQPKDSGTAPEEIDSKDSPLAKKFRKDTFGEPEFKEHPAVKPEVKTSQATPNKAGKVKEFLELLDTLNISEGKAQKISDSSKKTFIKYMLDFYGKGGTYDYGFTAKDVEAGLKIRLDRYTDSEFHGDSMDRELIRDIVLHFVKKDKGATEYQMRESNELEEATKAAKAFIGTADKMNYAVQINGVENDFPTKSFGQQIGDLKKVKEFIASAKKGRVSAKGKATLPAVKAWIKEFNPTEFYAKWTQDSSSYKDDSFDIYYK